MNAAGRILLAAAGVLLTAWHSAAQTQIRTVAVEGRGDTREAALANGLSEAVRRVNGVRLDLSQSVENAFRQSGLSVNGQAQSETSVSNQLQEQVTLATKGVVRGYEVDSLEKMGDEWSAMMRVRIAEYTAPGLSAETRRKIAIQPFSTASATFPVGTVQMSAATVRDDLTGAFNRFFTQSRRFAVLTRQDHDAIAAEQQVISAESPIEEMAKIGATLGADYLVCGTIRNLRVFIPGPAYGAGGPTSTPMMPRATIEVDYRIVMMATSQIKWADTVLIDMSREEIRACGDDLPTIYRTLIQGAGRGIARALDNIYPIRAVQIAESGELVLDQGAGLVVPGSRYDVFRLGAPVYGGNGELLGRSESKIASIVITRTDAKLSYGKVGEGAVTQDDIDRGLIVRLFRDTERSARRPSASAPEVTPAPAVPTTPSSCYPISVGLVPPIQTGGDADDVAGLDFGLLWTRHRDVAGVSYGSLGAQTLGSMLGFQLSALYSENGASSAGAQLSGALNLVRAGGFDGAQLAGGANLVFGPCSGVQISSCFNLCDDFEGGQLALVNIAGDMSGVQLGLYNQGRDVIGLQIGVVNMARTLRGVQIGLSNYVELGGIPWLPILNACF